MPKLIKYISLKLCFLLTIVLLGITGCYKDPFQNEEAVIVGKWKLIRINKFHGDLSGDLGDLTAEIPFDFIFEIQKEGILREYINDECTNRFRIRTNRLYENDGYPSKVSLSIFKFHGLNYGENHQSYIFYFKGLDTLVSGSYLPQRLYASSDANAFTFVKIE